MDYKQKLPLCGRCDNSDTGECEDCLAAMERRLKDRLAIILNGERIDDESVAVKC